LGGDAALKRRGGKKESLISQNQEKATGLWKKTETPERSRGGRKRGEKFVAVLGETVIANETAPFEGKVFFVIVKKKKKKKERLAALKKFRIAKPGKGNSDKAKKKKKRHLKEGGGKN